MRKMRIALGSNDGRNIVPSHMGMAADFYLYDLYEDGRSVFVEKRRNTSPTEEGKHGLAKKLKAATEIFKDADVVIGRRMSPNFRNMAEKTRFQPVVVECDGISEIMEAVARAFDEVYAVVEQRKQGDRPQEIPRLKGVKNGA